LGGAKKKSPKSETRGFRGHLYKTTKIRGGEKKKRGGGPKPPAGGGEELSTRGPANKKGAQGVF